MRPLLPIVSVIGLSLIPILNNGASAAPIPASKHEPSYRVVPCPPKEIAGVEVTRIQASPKSEFDNETSDHSSDLCILHKPVRKGGFFDMDFGHKVTTEEEDREARREGLKRLGLVFICVASVIAGLIYVSGLSYTVLHLSKQCDNFQRMSNYIEMHGRNQGQSRFKIFRRKICSWKLFGICLLCVVYFPFLFLMYIVGLIIAIIIFFRDRVFACPEYPEVLPSTQSPEAITRTKLDAYSIDETILKQVARNFEIPLTGHYIFKPYRDLDPAKYQLLPNQDACPICIEEYREMDFIIVLPCKHMFHYICLDDVRKTNAESMTRNSVMLRCPSCNLNLVRHHQYFVSHNLDQKRVAFDNQR